MGLTLFAQLPASARRPVVSVAATLIAADVLFVAADLLRRAAVLHDPRLLLTTERGYPEMLQYAKFVWVALVLSVTAADGWTQRLRLMSVKGVTIEEQSDGSSVVVATYAWLAAASNN